MVMTGGLELAGSVYLFIVVLNIFILFNNPMKLITPGMRIKSWLLYLIYLIGSPITIFISVTLLMLVEKAKTTQIREQDIKELPTIVNVLNENQMIVFSSEELFNDFIEMNRVIALKQKNFNEIVDELYFLEEEGKVSVAKREDENGVTYIIMSKGGRL